MADAAAAPALAHTLLRSGIAELARLRRIGGAHRQTARRIARTQALLALAALLAGAGAEQAGAERPFFLDPSRPFGLDAAGDPAPRPAFADLDGDGDLDALVGIYDQHVLFFENSGTVRRPDFAAPATDPFGIAGVGVFPVPALADVDGDGDLDLFVGRNDGQTVFFANTGSATAPAFGAGSSGAFGLPDVGTFAAPAFGDVDGDGDLDAFVGEYGGHVILFSNTGTASAPDFGVVGVTDPFGLTDVGYIATPAFVDIDGDGDLDAMAGSYFGTTVFWANSGTASVPAFGSDDGNPFGLELQQLLAGPSFPDLDGDGDLDAVIAHNTGALRFYRNTGTRSEPAFRPASRAFGLATPTAGVAPELADLDGDGDLDGLVGSYDGSLLFSENTGTRSSPALDSAATDPFGLAAAGSYASPALGDLDGDGDLDALVGDAAGGGALLFFANTGSAQAPAFAAAQTDPFCAGSLGGRPSPAFLDLDEDGDLDLMIGYDDGRLDFCRNEGTPQAPSFPTTDTNPFGLTSLGSNLTLAFADIANDAKVEGVLGQADGALLVAYNSQSAAVPFFVPTPAQTLGLADVGSDSSPTLADVDGDGDFDALVGGSLGPSSGYTTFFENIEIELLCPGAPRPDCTELAAGSLSINERKAGKEKLTLKLAPGTAGVAQAALGNPLVARGTELGLCLYDDAGERVANLAVERAGELCGAKPCWISIGGVPPDGKGFAYKDKLGTAQGVTSLVVRTGAAGATKLQAAASNNVAKGRTGLPTGLAALLLDSDGATVQLHATGGTCLTASFDEIKKQEPDYFKAK